VVAGEHPFQAEPLVDGQDQVAGRSRRLGAVVLGDHPAQHDPATQVQHVDGGFEMLAADVVEVQVDAVGRGGAQLVDDGAVVVVEGVIEAVFLDQQPDLVRAAGGADHPGRAHQPGDLTNLAAHRARRTRHEHRLSRLQARNPGQSRIRREPGSAQHAQVGGKWRGIGVDHGDVSDVEQRVLPPAQHVLHMRAHRDLVALRGDDDADRAALHRLVELERRHVGLHVVHPPPHVRIHRQELVAHQDLPRLRRQDLVLSQGEVTRRGPPVRPGDQMPLPAWCVATHDALSASARSVDSIR